MVKLLTLVLTAWLCFVRPPAFAHSLWINCFESFSHKPGHAIVSLGYGHQLPMDDLLNSKNAGLEIDTYALYAPDGNEFPLPIPIPVSRDSGDTGLGIRLSSGDIGLAKLGITDTAPVGTFQVGAVSKAGFFTLYENEKGRQKWAMTPMDQVKGRRIIQSCLYKAMAKACFVNGAWTKPVRLGHDLEISPAADISGVRAGDLVSFKIRFMDQPYGCTPSKKVRICAVSNTFGGPDNYYLAADIYNGRARIRIPTPGQWVVSVYVNQDVDKHQALSHLKEKTLQVHYSAALSFNVNP